MSWDIVLFNSRQNIESIKELDENSLELMDFCAAFKEYFEEVISEGSHWKINHSCTSK